MSLYSTLYDLEYSEIENDQSTSRKFTFKMKCIYTNDDKLKLFLDKLLKKYQHEDIKTAHQHLKKDFNTLLYQLDKNGNLFSDESGTVINFNLDDDGNVKTKYDPVKYYEKVFDASEIFNEHDRKFISNKLSNIYKRRKRIYDINVCILDENGNETEYYRSQKEIAQFKDEYTIYNPVTNNTLKYGFNY